MEKLVIHEKNAQMGIMKKKELRKMIPDEIDELTDNEGSDEFIQIGGGGGV